MLTQYNLKMPHAVYGGENAMDNITAIIKARGAKKVAMFTDKGIEGAGLFALPENAVKAAGAEYYVLDDLPPEPSYMTVQKLVDQFKASGADLIVACGGGSVMDAAKLASVLVTDDYGVKELLDNPGMAQKCVPIVLIPTTAGTGAEVTPNAIVAVPEKELKVGIVNENMIADYVILDARMIKNLGQLERLAVAGKFPVIARGLLRQRLDIAGAVRNDEGARLGHAEVILRQDLQEGRVVIALAQQGGLLVEQAAVFRKGRFIIRAELADDAVHQSAAAGCALFEDHKVLRAEQHAREHAGKGGAAALPDPGEPQLARPPAGKQHGPF